MSAEVEVNPYELLNVELEADERTIRTAYRQRSLKVHPDRNPNNPDAARKFHELNQAYELLLDPLRRLALDAKLRVKAAKAERFKSFDTKRKAFVEELEERERAFKKARMDKQKAEVDQWEANEKIKDEGRRLREEKEKEFRQREQNAKKVDEDEPPSIQPNDTTVRVKFSLSGHPDLTTPEALAAIFAPFGPTDTETIVLSLKATKKAPSKPPNGRPERGLKGIDITWVGGKEPEILGWLKKTGKLAAQLDVPSEARPNPEPQTLSSTMFSSFPETLPETVPEITVSPDIDYESLTLMRMRQAERERLEREILELAGILILDSKAEAKAILSLFKFKTEALQHDSRVGRAGLTIRYNDIEDR
ncbi:DnaJ domain-containing protein [Desarmillaria tabescens]|uniref:DnaJ domain-containing protein n=1 Tax=Armillaria tabescens TaxID=1929756 RepID=A0AA39TRY0_ARMTA|nr:DnaJ domain-containing protein [Desarmillaria tabescens]KAK0464503.1 DnaJ domain-containing protein [Desarmillaria tabescens]